MRQFCTLMLILGLSAVGATAPTARADIAGFGDGTGFTLNGNQWNPPVPVTFAPTIDDGVATMTTNVGSLATSLFYDTPQDVTSFVTHFDFQLVNPGADPADGIGLVIQNDPRQVYALGELGGNVGYAGGITNTGNEIDRSAAIMLAVYQWSFTEAGINGTLGRNIVGAAAQAGTSPVDLRSGNPIRVTVSYDGSHATLDLVDLQTLATVQRTLPVHIPAVTGGSTAYVGFTGGTGGAIAEQTISNFNFYEATTAETLNWNAAGNGNWGGSQWEDGGAAVAHFPTLRSNVTVATDTVTVEGNHAAMSLAVGSGAVQIAAGKSLSVTNGLDVAAGASIGIGNNASLSAGYGSVSQLNINGNASLVNVGTMRVGNLADGGTAGVFSKGGGGMLSIDGNAGTVDLNNTTLRIEAGTLALSGNTPLGGSTQPVQLAGGTLRITGAKPAIPALPAIAGLQLHLDGSDVTGNGFTPADGSVVATWADLSGNGLNATASGTPTFQSAGLGGMGAVHFDGGGGFTLGDLSATFPTAATLFVIAELDDDPHYNLFSTGSPDNWWRWNGNGLAYPGPFRNVRIENYTAMPTDGTHVFEVVSSATNWEMFQDGVSKGAVAMNPPAAAYDPGSDYRIGMNDNGTAEKNLVGDIGEVLVFDRPLASIERAMVRDYLTQKYTPPAAISMTGTDFVVSENSTINVVTATTADFGTLTLENGVVTTSGAPGGMRFTQTNIAASATAVGLDPRTDTHFGPITGLGGGGGPSVTITKAGPSTMTLTQAPVNLSNATWDAGGGTLQMTGSAPWGGATKMKLSGGTFTVTETPDTTPVDPSMISGRVLHLDASDVDGDGNPDFITDGSSVATWVDKSGNGNNATLSRGNTTYWADANGDGHPAVEFPEGAGMITPLNVFGDDYTVFILFDSNEDSAVARRAIHGSNNWLIGPYSGQLRYHMNGWAYTGAENMAVDQYAIAVVDNSTTDWAFYEDGVQRAAGAGSRGTPGVISFGAENPWDERLLGDVAEVLIFDRSLSDIELDQVGFYLEDKYGLSTPYGTGTIPALDYATHSVEVTADSTLNAATNMTATFGDLTLRGGTLTTTGAGGGISFNSITVDVDPASGLEAGLNPQVATSYGAGPLELKSGVIKTTGNPVTFNGVNIPTTAAAVGFNPEVATTYGTIDGNLAAAVVSKTGSGTMVLGAGDAVEMNNATWDARGGTLRMVGTGAWAGSNEAQLSGGTMQISIVPIPLRHNFSTAAYYSFDNVSGTTVVNEGFLAGIDGTLTDGATITTAGGGMAGEGMATADNSDQRLVAAGGGVDLGEQWTISSWFYNLHPNDTWRTLARGETNDHQVIVGAGNNDLGVYDSASGGGFRDSGADLSPDAAWHLATAVGEGSTTRLYVDGAYVGTSDRKSTSEVTWIGNHSGGQPFAEKIDEFRVYDRALSAAEVQTLFDDVGAAVATLSAINMTGKNFTVTDDSNLLAASDSTAAFGNLTLEGGTVTVAGAPDGVSFNSLTVNAPGAEGGVNLATSATFGAGPVALQAGVLKTDGRAVTFNGVDIPVTADAVGLNPVSETTYGQIDGNLMNGIVAKTGPGTLTLGTDNTAVNFGSATWEVAGGTLKMIGAAAWGGSKRVRLSGGELQVLGASPVASAGPADALAYWAFEDDPAGSTAVDSSGHFEVYDGTVMPGATFTSSGLLGQGMAFDGSSQAFVDLPDGFDDFGNGISVAAWVNIREFNSFARVIEFGNGVNVDNIALTRRGVEDDLFWAVEDGELPGGRDFFVDDVHKLNTWQHIVVTTDGDAAHTTRVYVDGVQVATGDNNLPGFVTRTENAIGKSNWPTDDYFHGVMDEVYIYERALDATQVEQLYGNGFGPHSTPLPALAMTGHDFTVTDDSSLLAGTDSRADFGELALENGVLTIRGAPDGVSFTRTTVPATAMVTGINAETEVSAGPLTLHGGVLRTSGAPIEFDSTEIHASATSVGLDPRTTIDYGVITGGGAAGGPAVTISKLGSGNLALTGTNANLANATWDAHQGTLAMVGTGPLGRATELLLSGGTFKIAGALSDADLGPAGAQAYYSFDDSGDPGLDDTFNGYDTSLMSGAAWTANGMLGAGAIRLDGVNDYLSTNIDVSEGTLSGYAVAMWFKSDRDTSGLFSVRDVDFGGGNDRNIYLNQGNVSGRVWSEETVTSSGLTVGDGLWHHVVHTFGDAEGGQKLYIDGVLAADGDLAASNFDLQEVINIGYDHLAAPNFFGGLVDEFYVYDRALNAAEVAAMAGERAAVDVSAIHVTVTGNSTLAAAGGNRVTFAALTMKYGTLTTSGVPVSFPTTTIDPNASLVGFNPTTDTNLGPIDGSNAPATIRKTGSGDLVLRDPGSNLGNATFSAEQGRLIAIPDGSNPLGEATLQTAGGELVLSAKAGSASPVLYDNAVTGAGGTLTAGTGDQADAAGGPMTVQVGSAGTHDVTVADGNSLRLRSTDDFTLDLVGNISGQGRIVVDEADSKIVLSGPAGSIGSLSVTDGTVGTAGNDLGVGSLKLADHGYEVAGSSMAVRGPDLLSDATVVVRGGTLTITGPGSVPGDALIYYGFDSVAANETPNGGTGGAAMDGVLSGAVVEGIGKLGGALEFNGGRVTTKSTVPLLNPEYTVSVWLNSTAQQPAWRRIVLNHSYQNGSYLGTEGTGDTYQTIVRGVFDVVGGAVDDDPDVWQHVVATYDGTSTRLYVDGAVVAGPIAMAGPAPATDWISIGNNWSAADEGWRGLIDEVYIYERALNDTEIAGLLAAGSGGGGMTVEQETTSLAITANATVTTQATEAALGNLTVADGVTAVNLENAVYSFNNVSVADGVTVAGEWEIGGSLSVGNSVGTMTLGTGELVLGPNSSYHVEVDLGNGAALTADQIVIADDGWLVLDGTLKPQGIGRTDNSFFASNTTLTVVDNPGFGGLSDADDAVPHEFAAVDPAPANDASAHIGQGAFLRDVVSDSPNGFVTKAVNIEVFVALGGDADGDRKVWLSDWAALRANFGNTGTGKTWIEGNFDPWNDGKVWLSDWAALRAGFGNSDYTVGEASAVPEPGTTVMLLLAGLAALGVAARRHR